MKLHKFHIFLILLGSLILCSMGFSAIEGMKNSNDTISTNKTNQRVGNRVDQNLSLGSKNDPFENAVNLEFVSEGDKVQNSVPASKMKAIPKNQISKGDEDLYILKSQIVRPVCPKCPDVKRCDSSQNNCAPCPAPKRCPERPYECKMVPKYNDPRVSSHLPRPVLNNFSSFA